MWLALFLLIPVTQEDPEWEFTFSGAAEVDAVYRDGTLNEASFWTPGGIAPESPFRQSQDFISPLFDLRFGVRWKNDLSLHMELRNRRIVDNAAPPLQNEFLEGEFDDRLTLRQLYFSVKNWPLSDLEISFGLKTIPTHDENPLFLSSRAESPWGELPDSTTPPFPASGSNTVPQTRRMETPTTGVHARYEAKSWDLFVWILPGIEEKSGSFQEEGFYGARFVKALESAEIGVVAAWMGGGVSSRVGTIGVDGKLEVGFLTGRLEGFAQFGKVDDRDAQGFALRSNLEANFDPFRISLEYLWVSGDKDGLDDKEGRFLSYEDNDTAPLVEGNEFGLDIDNNYHAFRFAFGVEWLFSKRRAPLFLETRLHRFFMDHRVPLPPDPAFSVSERSRDLGWEWDLKATYPLNQAVELSAEFSTLFSSGVLEQFTADNENSAWLVTFGTRVEF